MSMLNTTRLAALTSLAAFTLAACATSSEPEDVATQPEATMEATHDAMDDAMDKEPTDGAMEKEPTEDAMAEEVAVPDQLQWSAPTVAGGEFDGASLAGTDAILWIWASWCPVCQAEAPTVAAASAQLPEGVEIYGLPGRSDQAAAEAFVEFYELEGFDHIMDEEATLWANFGISYQPAFVLINDDGTIESIPGSLSEQGILDAAEQLAAT